MATTVKESFKQYASNLNITDRQESVVATCRSNVVDAIGKQLTLHTEKSRVIGSWDRDTLIRYLSESDIDVMVILHHGKNKDWDNSSGATNALTTFKDILTNAYPDTPSRRDEHCVSMQLSQFRLDVVPAFKYDEGYYAIPDTQRGQWIYTDPIAFASKITAVNKTMDGTFVPLIKMVKGWNKEAGKPIRSFHLETMLYEHYRTYEKSYTYNSTIKVFLEALPDYLASSCFDPITGDRLDGYLDNSTSPTKREVAISKAKNAAQKAKEAYEDEEKYPSVAIGEWKNLLGEFFPAYG
jgi:Second Messenger Oligonucleotide or Dinucleotide Synthetase domain